MRLPYGRHWITDEDIRAVTDVLSTDWITQGPKIAEFERAVAEFCGARFAVAVSSGTAALHLAALAAQFGPGDEVITTPITFVASANCALYTGAKPVFADIEIDSLNIDPVQVKKRLTAHTKGIIAVHFTGQPCDMPAIWNIAKDKGICVIEDASHAIGASYDDGGRSVMVGSCAHSHMTVFSYHPVKHITTGEGGMITTNDEALYNMLLMLRAHGITRDPELLTRNDGPWYYEMQNLGYNYRITDFACALGLKQLEKLEGFIERRREIARAYDDAFRKEEELVIPFEKNGFRSSWHLYVVQVKNLDRLKVFQNLRESGLGVNVHYIPVHFQPYYRDRFGYGAGDYPKAERYYSRAVTLPLYPGMSPKDVSYVISTVQQFLEHEKSLKCD
jgi:perosamine synthetase